MCIAADVLEGIGSALADPTSTEPDELTLARLRQGDIGALARVFELFALRVHRLSRRMIGNQADAEDVAQEIFLRVFEQAGKFDGRSRFSTWLYRLAVRHCLNRIKQRDRRIAAESRAHDHAERNREPMVHSPFERLVTQDDLALVDELLASLPPHYRACVVLREIEGLSYAQIAELLEIPVGTVMSRLARARQSLRARLAESHEERRSAGNSPARAVVQNTEEQTHHDLL